MSNDPDFLPRPEKVTAPSRRTLVAGAAWTVPVIAIAAASPLASASAPCTWQPAQRLNATATNTATRVVAQTTVPVPANVVTIRYTVVGGRGGGGTDTDRQLQAVLSGTFPASLVAGGSLQLVAGSAGTVGNGVNTAGLGGVGFGNGGNATAVGNGVGGGGAASAIVVGGTPLVVAGGSGGRPNAAWSAPASVNWVVAGAANAGLPGGDAGQGGSWRRSTNQPADPWSFSSGGGGGTQTGPGGGGPVGGPRSQSIVGNPGAGRNGGNGVRLESDIVYGSGGGGGGYFGGGSGSAVYWDGVTPTGGTGASRVNAAGGGGSSYRAAGLTALSETTAAFVNAGQGYVQIEFCTRA